MKVNRLGVLISFLAIIAVFDFEVLSAAVVPQSDEKKSEEPAVSSTDAAVNGTESNLEDLSDSSEDASVENSSDTLPPLEFPSETRKNDTALRILQSHSASSLEDIIPIVRTSVTKVELSSTTSRVPASTETVIENSTVSINKTTTEEDYDDLSDEETEKNDSENIQDNESKAQEELEEEFAKTGSLKASINLGEDPVTNIPVLHSGHIALIFASTLVVLSVVAYIGLILWRGRLEQRYGMRQRLVTEDDFYNNNDVRYFGL